MDKEGRGDRGGRGVNHGGDVYSVGERLGATLEILTDSVRVFHLAQYGENSWTYRIRKRV